MAETEGVQEDCENKMASETSASALEFQESGDNTGNSPVDDLYEVERIVGCSKIHVSWSNFAPVFTQGELSSNTIKHAVS